MESISVGSTFVTCTRSAKQDRVNLLEESKVGMRVDLAVQVMR